MWGYHLDLVEKHDRSRVAAAPGIRAGGGPPRRQAASSRRGIALAINSVAEIADLEGFAPPRPCPDSETNTRCSRRVACRSLARGGSVIPLMTACPAHGRSRSGASSGSRLPSGSGTGVKSGVALLKADRLDPDMLDERARQLLDYADPRDVTVLIRHRDWPASGRKRAPLIGR
jgi:hypothetical protein